MAEEQRKVSAGQAVERIRADESLTNPYYTFYGGNFIELMYKAAHNAAQIYAGTEIVNVNIGDVSIERPILVGEVAFAAARVTYVGKTSLEVECYVVMDDASLTPVVRAAHFTFVALGRDGKKADMPLPIFETGPERELFDAGKQRREELMLDKKAKETTMGIPITIPCGANESFTLPSATAPRCLKAGFSTSTYIVFPSDAENSIILGGRLAGYMDNTAATAATFYSGKNCVTVSMHGIHFDRRLRLGELAIVAAQVEYVGSSSLMVRIDVDRRTASEWSAIVRGAYYGFVAIGDDKKPTSVPVPLVPEEMKRMFEDGRRMQRLIKSRRDAVPKEIPLERCERRKMPVFVR